MKAGHGGFACASCTDFFGLFLLACRLAFARVLVMWDGYVERPWDLDSDRVLYIYINMVLCVLRVLSVRWRARPHEDQAGLWSEQLVPFLRKGDRPPPLWKVFSERGHDLFGEGARELTFTRTEDPFPLPFVCVGAAYPREVKVASHSPSRCMQRRGEERAHHRHHNNLRHPRPELIIRMSSSPEGSNRRSARVRRDV